MKTNDFIAALRASPESKWFLSILTGALCTVASSHRIESGSLQRLIAAAKRNRCRKQSPSSLGAS